MLSAESKGDDDKPKKRKRKSKEKVCSHVTLELSALHVVDPTVFLEQQEDGDDSKSKSKRKKKKGHKGDGVFLSDDDSASSAEEDAAEEETVSKVILRALSTGFSSSRFRVCHYLARIAAIESSSGRGSYGLQAVVAVWLRASGFEHNDEETEGVQDLYG